MLRSGQGCALGLARRGLARRGLAGSAAAHITHRSATGQALPFHHHHEPPQQRQPWRLRHTAAAPPRHQMALVRARPGTEDGDQGPPPRPTPTTTFYPSPTLLLLGRRFGTSTRLGASSGARHDDRSSTGEQATSSAAGAVAEVEDESKMGKLKLMMKRYGAVAVVTYFGVYVSTLGVLYAAIESGVNPFDYGLDSGSLMGKVTAMLEGYSWSQPILDSIEKNPHVGNFALAWIMTKFTEPLRMLVTFGIVPPIARALGRAPPKPVKVKK